MNLHPLRLEPSGCRVFTEERAVWSERLNIAEGHRGKMVIAGLSKKCQIRAFSTKRPCSAFRSVNDDDVSDGYWSLVEADSDSHFGLSGGAIRGSLC